jgi:hypothetical protein
MLQLYPDKAPELWIWPFCMSKEEATKRADERNVEMQGTAESYVSPENPFFVVRIIKEERVEVVK